MLACSQSGRKTRLIMKGDEHAGHQDVDDIEEWLLAVSGLEVKVTSWRLGLSSGALGSTLTLAGRNYLIPPFSEEMGT